MARLLETRRECEFPSCKGRVETELRNRANRTLGFYCQPHGFRKLVELRAVEEGWHPQFEALKDAHAGETMVLVGNGPSYNNVPQALFEKYPTIGMNWLSAWKPFRPTYWTALDSICFDAVEFLPEETVPLLIGHDVRGGWQKKKWIDRVVPYAIHDDTIEVSWTEKSGMKWSNTMFQAGHLALYMGAKRLLIVGFDCSGGDGPGKHRGKGITDMAHAYDDGKRQTYHSGWDSLAKLFRLVALRRGCEVINLSSPTMCRNLPKGSVREWL